MTWCSDCNDNRAIDVQGSLVPSFTNTATAKPATPKFPRPRNCPSCGHHIQCPPVQAGGIQDLPGLPAGMKFDPTDQELLEHLEGKVRPDAHRLHPLIDEFIPTLEGEDGICYTHPEKLPGLTKEGLIRHFFHRPSKAYTTGTRKRRKVQADLEGNETRWHKTGKTKPLSINGKVKGYKKILVLYTSYGKQKRPEKTSWVMHQYHLGHNETEKDGELVVSKVFYQTQPRHCGTMTKDSVTTQLKDTALASYYNPSLISFKQHNHAQSSTPSFTVQGRQQTNHRGGHMA